MGWRQKMFDDTMNSVIEGKEGALRADIQEQLNNLPLIQEELNKVTDLPYCKGPIKSILQQAKTSLRNLKVDNEYFLEKLNRGKEVGGGFAILSGLASVQAIRKIDNYLNNLEKGQVEHIKTSDVAYFCKLKNCIVEGIFRDCCLSGILEEKYRVYCPICDSGIDDFKPEALPQEMKCGICEEEEWFVVDINKNTEKIYSLKKSGENEQTEEY